MCVWGEIQGAGSSLTGLGLGRESASSWLVFVQEGAGDGKAWLSSSPPSLLPSLLSLLSFCPCRVTGPVSLDLSHCGGLSDSSLLELLPWEQQAAACTPSRPHTQPPTRPGSPPEGWGSSGGQLGQHRSQPGASWSSSDGGSSYDGGGIGSGCSNGDRGLEGPAGGGPLEEGVVLGAARPCGEAWIDAAGKTGVGAAVETAAGAVAEAEEGGIMVLEELSVAGSSRISASALLQLATWGTETLEPELSRGRAGATTAAVTAAAVAGEDAAAGAPARHPVTLPTGPLLATLRVLDVSHCECFRGGGALSYDSGAAVRSALLTVLRAAGPALRVLRADGCQLGGGLLGALAAACPNLRELSVVGCRGIADTDFCALAAGMAGLQKLAVGGAVLSWREETSLKGGYPPLGEPGVPTGNMLQLIVACVLALPSLRRPWEGLSLLGQGTCCEMPNLCSHPALPSTANTCPSSCHPCPSSSAHPCPWAHAGFTGLTSLRIARRSFLADQQLQSVLSACGASLRELALASCPALSDAALAALPPGLPHLHLVCCERLTGGLGRRATGGAGSGCSAHTAAWL